MRHKRPCASISVAHISVSVMLIAALVILGGSISSTASPIRFVVAAFTPQQACKHISTRSYHLYHDERPTIVVHANSENDPPPFETHDDDSNSNSDSDSNGKVMDARGGAYLRRVARGVEEMGKMKESVEPGDVIFAKLDIASLGIYRDVGYDVTSIYHQGLDEETGRIDKRPVASLDEPVPRGFTRYVTLYSPVHHGDDIDEGAVIVTPEEVGLVSMKAEVTQSLLLAVPGLFWVGLCIAFTNIYTERYGGTFMDALLGR